MLAASVDLDANIQVFAGALFAEFSDVAKTSFTQIIVTCDIEKEGSLLLLSVGFLWCHLAIYATLLVTSSIQSVSMSTRI